MTLSESLCRHLIKEHLKRYNQSITSWDEFGESKEWEIISEDVSQNRLLRAMAFGKEKGWLIAQWHGVGLTPYAGSARRQRCYKITEKGRREVLGE